MTYYHVIKPDGSFVQVVLFRHKNTEQWSFINLTEQHICVCRFNSKEDTLADMEQRKQDGLIVDYFIFTV